jgi:hypothetical protein
VCRRGGGRRGSARARVLRLPDGEPVPFCGGGCPEHPPRRAADPAKVREYDALFVRDGDGA